MSEFKRLSAKRVVFYLAGVITMTFGIALSIKAGIGVAPASTVSYAVSQLTPLTVGTCVTLFHTFCLLLQLAFTRRITITFVLQLPFSYVFGRLIDLFDGLLVIVPANFAASIGILVLATLIFSLGLRAIVGADIVMAPADSLTKAAGAKIGWPMSSSKLAFDLITTASAAVVMLVSKGIQSVISVVGVGTVICALATGPAIGVYTKLFPFLDTAKTSERA